MPEMQPATPHQPGLPFRQLLCDFLLKNKNLKIYKNKVLFQAHAVP